VLAILIAITIGLSAAALFWQFHLRGADWRSFWSLPLLAGIGRLQAQRPDEEGRTPTRGLGRDFSMILLLVVSLLVIGLFAAGLAYAATHGPWSLRRTTTLGFFGLGCVTAAAALVVFPVVSPDPNAKIHAQIGFFTSVSGIVTGIGFVLGELLTA
jgi:hypothetical protein